MKFVFTIALFFILIGENVFSQNTIPAVTFDTAAFRCKLEMIAKDVNINETVKIYRKSAICWGAEYAYDTTYIYYRINPFNQQKIYMPEYVQGAFCNFEDYINKNRKLRINFGVE